MFNKGTSTVIVTVHVQTTMNAEKGTAALLAVASSQPLYVHGYPSSMSVHVVISTPTNVDKEMYEVVASSRRSAAGMVLYTTFAPDNMADKTGMITPMRKSLTEENSVKTANFRSK